MSSEEQTVKTQRQVVAEVLVVALAAGIDHDKTIWEQAEDLADEVMAALAQEEDEGNLDEAVGFGEPFAHP